MAQHMLDLGHLDMLSTSSGLRLQLTSCAEFATSEQVGGQLGMLDTCDAHALQEHASTYQHDLPERLAQSLFDAVLWRQLQLEPTAKEVSVGSLQSSTSIQVYLDYAKQNAENPKRKAHKLAQDVPYHHVSPPSGIQTAEIRHVALHMQFSNRSGRKRLKLSSDDETPLGLDNDMLEMSSISRSRIADMNSCKATITHGTSNIPERCMSSLSTAHSTSQGIGSIEFGGPAEDSRVHSPTMLKRCLSTSDIDTHSADGSEEDVFALFDAGIRHAIATPAKRSLNGIEIAGNESLKQLANICPSIFSPGHMEGISSRAVHLPTISHALSHISGVHARSSTLRNKFAELTRRRVVAHSQDNSFAARQVMISTHLWQSMRDSLQQRDLAPQLRPVINASLKIARGANFDLGKGRCEDASDVYFGDRPGDEVLFDVEGLEYTKRAALTTEPTPESSQEDGHAMSMTQNVRAREAHMVDVEEDLLSICGSAHSLAFEDNGFHDTLPNLNCAAHTTNVTQVKGVLDEAMMVWRACQQASEL